MLFQDSFLKPSCVNEMITWVVMSVKLMSQKNVNQSFVPLYRTPIKFYLFKQIYVHYLSHKTSNLAYLKILNEFK